ncbi:unannotated protein [freshwater metagenome]|jgi:hypothetical protein|uniref:Unannotated protein n=1 Tax=freshwater metagenome TaxID=449393 RepID=A0A6J7KB23_9ZZZZ
MSSKKDSWTWSKLSNLVTMAARQRTFHDVAGMIALSAVSGRWSGLHSLPKSARSTRSRVTPDAEVPVAFQLTFARRHPVGRR